MTFVVNLEAGSSHAQLKASSEVSHVAKPRFEGWEIDPVS